MVKARKSWELSSCQAACWKEKNWRPEQEKGDNRVSATGRKGREKSTNYKYKSQFSENYKRMEKYRRQDRFK